MIEKQSIINLNCYECYASVVLGDFEVTFLRKEENAAFCSFLYYVWLYMALQNWSSNSSNFLVFHTSGGISSKASNFSAFNFVSVMLSSSWVNCPSLTSSWLSIIFVIVLSVTLGDFLSRFLKYSFHICICSSWLAAFSFSLEEPFLLITSFTVCHAIHDCLSSTKFLILLIWSWMCSFCSCWYVLVLFVSS